VNVAQVAMLGFCLPHNFKQKDLLEGLTLREVGVRCGYSREWCVANLPPQ
ncbi:hypothetical protein SAMN02746041_03210, partial [Desulfacinum hydrothermale DSM 13146]